MPQEPKPDDDKTALVCARADSLFTIEGSTFDQVCAACGVRVMLSPSGQRHLREHPDAVILCMQCLPIDVTMEDVARNVAARKDELLSELQNVKPNFWRKRN